MPRGFILQPTHRIDAGRPVVHLYGTLETGEPFLVRDTRTRPHFWIRRDDAERAAGAGAVHREEPGRRTMAGEPVVRIEVDAPSDAPPVRDRLIALGIATYEADVRFAQRYLIDRGIRGGLEIRGGEGAGGGGDEAAVRVFDDPEIAPADWTPTLSVLSIDIETDPTARRLLSIALAGCGAAEVLLVTPPGHDCPASATRCADERELLELFVRRVRELDPDVLTGWNFVDFDLAVLERVAARIGLPLVLGRGPEALRLRASSSPRARSEARVTGRLVMDGIQLLRGAFVRLESYALDAAARSILGVGKTMTGRDRGQQILHAFHHDRDGFVAYNLNDAQLVLDILDRLHLIELAVQRSRLTGMPPDRVDASIASFDFLYLSELARLGLVAPSVREVPGLERQGGGHVLDPTPGLYRNVLVLDFKSLYPAIIRTFQIDPLGRLRATADGVDPITAPNGAAFSRDPGILPRLLDELVPRREAAKRAGDEVASHAVKILMNSFYGVLGTSVCRFASPDLVNAITGFGRELLLWTRARIESAGHRVVYGDTDSLFVPAASDRVEDARALGTRLARELTAELARHVAERWGVESRLELEFEKLYLRLLLPIARGGTSGARKRYAGLLDGDGEPRVVFTGMEAIRRDWTPLARRVQRELYERLFSDRPVDAYLRRVVADVRAGRLDEQLVYRKNLRRRLDSYTRTTPPHVAAARKMSDPPRRVIAYVMTRAGPEPAAERRAEIDHEHYVQKQVRAVAEPVLTLLDLEFDAVVGDEHQLRLFR